jgi:hypothetical protein
MNTTRKAIQQRGITLKAMRRPLNAELLRSVSVGPTASIRSTDLSGTLQPENTSFNIDGCDWRGAAYIYFKFEPYHEAIADGDCFYFMKPRAQGPDFVEPLLTREATAIICLHHFYSRFLDEGSVPPFRTDIGSKIHYMSVLLKTREYENELVSIQRQLGYRTFRKWGDFVQHLETMAAAAADDATVAGGSGLMKAEERLERLGLLIRNAEELVRFLLSPIDDTETIVEQLDFIGDAAGSDALTSLVLEKLDWHEIFLETDQEPMAIDWVRRLDVILNRKRE